MSSTSSLESDSFSSIQADFERLTETLSHFQENLEAVGENLTKIQKPIENLEIEQLHNPAFLEQSPFRMQKFLLKSCNFSAICKVDMHRRYSFSEICTGLRNYLFDAKLVNQDGSIRVNEPLQTLLKLPSSSVNISYLDLLARLTVILV